MFDTEHAIEASDRRDEFETSVAVVLSSATRKRALAALTNADGYLSVTELARTVADGDDIQRRTVTSLYHCDLPKLAAYDLVEWDPETRRATATSEGATCVAALDL